MSEVRLTRSAEAWSKVDPLYLMQRVASGETSGTAAYNLMRDALADIAALTRRCRELEEQAQHAAFRQQSDESAYSAVVRQNDALRAEVERLRQALRSVIVAAGGSAAPDVSTEFLEQAPLEVLALRGNLDRMQTRLRAEVERLERIVHHLVRVYVVSDDVYDPGAAVERAMARPKEQIK